jgi:threonine synthase
VARKLGLPADGKPCVVAATATPYKFPETCLRAFGEDVLNDPPPAFAALETAPVTQNQVVDVAEIDDAVRALFA